MKEGSTYFGEEGIKEIPLLERENNAECLVKSVDMKPDNLAVSLEFKNVGTKDWSLGNLKIIASPIGSTDVLGFKEKTIS